MSFDYFNKFFAFTRIYDELISITVLLGFIAVLMLILLFIVLGYIKLKEYLGEKANITVVYFTISAWALFFFLVLFSNNTSGSMTVAFSGISTIVGASLGAYISGANAAQLASKNLSKMDKERKIESQTIIKAVQKRIGTLADLINSINKKQLADPSYNIEYEKIREKVRFINDIYDNIQWNKIETNIIDQLMECKIYVKLLDTRVYNKSGASANYSNLSKLLNEKFEGKSFIDLINDQNSLLKNYLS
ncbi:hypothetical protein [Sporolactobacillus sp. KGMB 08714]|uniref:hypothetical protein n=1 Tax=Sporolactobacillus sp. KGMB 08714 TaxID=3064704 RepID=UPI002FBEE17A